MEHVQIDIETVDTLPTAVILSIGAVFFNPETGELGPELLIKLDRQQPGRTESKATLAWWNNQSQGARDEAFGGSVHIIKALDELAAFIQNECGDDCIAWGNGSTFDMTILEDAYRGCGFPGLIPWKFWNVRDCRTIEWVATHLISRKSIAKDGMHHKALDDAKYQAKYISAMVMAIKGL